MLNFLFICFRYGNDVVQYGDDDKNYQISENKESDVRNIKQFEYGESRNEQRKDLSLPIKREFSFTQGKDNVFFVIETCHCLLN